MTRSTPTVKAATKAHPLAPAVLRQLGGGAEAVQTALDAAEHGADAGFGGFTYYRETCAFAARHRQKIAAAVQEFADQMGNDGPIALVRGFRCLDNPSDEAITAALYGGRHSASLKDEVMLIENALAWFALEEVGRAIESLAD